MIGFSTSAILIPIVVFFITCQNIKSADLAKVNDEKITVAEFLATLPKGKATETEEETLTRYEKHLKDLINRRLFIQEATQNGLESLITDSYNASKKTILIQKLLSQMIIEKAKASPAEIRRLYKILPVSVHLRIITTNDKTQAQLIRNQLQAGVPFESCAYKFSSHPSSINGGDVGFGKLAFLPEPIRLAIENLTPGAITAPIPTENGFALVQLLEKKTEAVGSLAQEELSIRSFIEQQKAKKLHQEFFNRLNARLVYNHKALRVFFKPANAITEEEKELWVVKKDETLMVRVKSLLPVAESFNPAIDTNLRIYAIKREIEDDLLYEEAKRLGYDKDKKILQELNKIREELLYSAFYQQAINSKINVTDEEILAYYQANITNYPSGWNQSVRDLIKDRILTDRKKELEAKQVQLLAQKAKIEINQAQLKSLAFAPKSKKE